jgi:hypothetical protein
MDYRWMTQPQLRHSLFIESMGCALCPRKCNILKLELRILYKSRGLESQRLLESVRQERTMAADTVGDEGRLAIQLTMPGGHDRLSSSFAHATITCFSFLNSSPPQSGSSTGVIANHCISEISTTLSLL